MSGGEIELIVIIDTSFTSICDRYIMSEIFEKSVAKIMELSTRDVTDYSFNIFCKANRH